MRHVSLVVAAFALALAGCDAGPRTDVDEAQQPETPAVAPAPATPEVGVANAFKPFVNPQGRITQGRCHMDVCGWKQWDTLDVVKTSKDGVELRALVRSGQSDHANKAGNGADDTGPDYPKTADGAAIEWDATPATVDFLCSKTKPTMKWGDEESVVLPLNPDGFIAGAMESAVRSYFVACHSDFSDGPGDAAVVKYGYRVPLKQ